MEFHIPTIAPETLFHLGGFAVTNTMINAWLAIALFALLGWFLRGRVTLRPGGNIF